MLKSRAATTNPSSTKTTFRCEGTMDERKKFSWSRPIAVPEDTPLEQRYRGLMEAVRAKIPGGAGRDKALRFLELSMLNARWALDEVRTDYTGVGTGGPGPMDNTKGGTKWRG